MSEIRALVTMHFDAARTGELQETVDLLTAKAADEDGVRLAYAITRGGDTLLVNEHYRGADEMLAHLTGMDPAVVEKLVALVSIESMVVCGPVSANVEEVLKNFGDVTYADTISESV